MKVSVLKALVPLILAAIVFSTGFLVGNVIQGPLVLVSKTTEIETLTSVMKQTEIEKATVTTSVVFTITRTEVTTSVYISTFIRTMVIPTTPTYPGGVWREIIRFSGSADMTTQPVYVPSTMWRIRWSYGTSQYAAFAFYVYPLGETAIYVESVSSSTPSGTGTTYVYKGPGNFYLKILAANIQYTIIVEAPT